MHRLEAASFDLFSRYSHVHAFRTRHLGPEPLSILDVGDPAGTIDVLFPADHTVSLDLYADDASTERGHQHVVGSGFDLPFADGTFDLVASHDVFEHVPADRRLDIVNELLRVSRGPVVLVAPFDDLRTRRCEQIVNAQFATRVGRSLSPLDEHAACGLPDLDALTTWLAEQDVDHLVHGDGWLYHWLAFYLIKASLVSDGAHDDLCGLDLAINQRLQEADHRTPHYRRTVIMRPGVERLDLPPLQAEETPDAVGAEVDRLTQLGYALTAALPIGENPMAAGSSMRAWIDTHLGDVSPTGELARSVATAFAAIRRPVAAAVPRRSDELPGRRVSVVIVNLDGADYLRACLDSLADQDYPEELTEVLVVDNGSTDGSLALLADEYPWARVLPQGRNTGFAPAVKTGVEAATGECIALINNDMRADRDWLSMLVEAYSPEDGYVCVAGQILSWDGASLDFGHGAVSFYGMGYQVGFGTPVERTEVTDGRELLFACGGSMLVGREVYLASGGFDPKFFAYFEDVDFGWRLWLLGHKVRMAAGARTYHRLHGTSSRFPEHQRMVLYERNALRMIIKNYDELHLQQILGPAVLLLVQRAVTRGKLDPAAFQLGGDAGPTEEVPRLALAHLHAVTDVLEDFDDLMAERTRIQLARRRGDDEILSFFDAPLHPVLIEREYIEAQQRIVAQLQLPGAFRRQRAGRLLIVANDGDEPKGAGVRAVEMARALLPTVPVTIAVAGSTAADVDGIELAAYEDAGGLRRLAFEADVIVLQGETLRSKPALEDVPAVLVGDLSDPRLFAAMESRGPIGPSRGDDDTASAEAIQLLDSSDFFICASERQRDYWLGRLAARGRLDENVYAQDPSLRDLIDVVPFGTPDRPLCRDGAVLSDLHPTIDDDDLVVVSEGETYDWLDPLAVVDAFQRVVERVPRAKLLYLGPRPEPMHDAGEAVIFAGRVADERREALLADAHVAVTAARDVPSARLASRSQVFDYLWAGLPVVCTTGDALADEVRMQGAGIAVPPEQPRLLADAIVRLLEDAPGRAQYATRARRMAASYSWRHVVGPVRRVVDEPWRWRAARAARHRSRGMAEDAQALLRDDRRQIAEIRHLLAARTDEVAALRTRIGELEARVAHQERRLAPIRNSPLMPIFRRARRLLRNRRRED